MTQYWANGMWNAADQMGRPAINTVFNTPLVDANAGPTKNRFNTTPPSQQRTAFGGQFRNNIIATLTNINARCSAFGCTDYDAATAGAIADILLPDVITYDVSTPADGTAQRSRPGRRRHRRRAGHHDQRLRAPATALARTRTTCPPSRTSARRT